MNGRYENLVVDWFISVLVVGNSVTPSGPLILFHVPIIIVDESTLWIFDLGKRSEYT